MEWYRLDLNYACEPFFLFKNHESQSYGAHSSASINVKISSQDSTDFAMTRRLILIYPLAYYAVMSAISQWSHNHFAILFFARTATSLWSIFYGSGSS
jgi:hypothetical protein